LAIILSLIQANMNLDSVKLPAYFNYKFSIYSLSYIMLYYLPKSF
jgi:hypothetical protein